MLAEAIIENNEMKIINFPKGIFKSKHFKVNIEPVKEMKKYKKNNTSDSFFDKFQIDLTHYKFNRDDIHER